MRKRRTKRKNPKDANDEGEDEAGTATMTMTSFRENEEKTSQALPRKHKLTFILSQYLFNERVDTPLEQLNTGLKLKMNKSRF